MMKLQNSFVSSEHKKVGTSKAILVTQSAVTSPKTWIQNLKCPSFDRKSFLQPNRSFSSNSRVDHRKLLCFVATDTMKVNQHRENLRSYLLVLCFGHISRYCTVHCIVSCNKSNQNTFSRRSYSSLVLDSSRSDFPPQFQLATWSPVGRALVVVHDNNIYFHPDVKDRQSQGFRKLTTSGVKGVIYNGVADWLYEGKDWCSG